jgi:hypothetical protein
MQLTIRPVTILGGLPRRVVFGYVTNVSGAEIHLRKLRNADTTGNVGSRALSTFPPRQIGIFPDFTASKL